MTIPGDRPPPEVPPVRRAFDRAAMAVSVGIALFLCVVIVRRALEGDWAAVGLYTVPVGLITWGAGEMVYLWIGYRRQKIKRGE